VGQRRLNMWDNKHAKSFLTPTLSRKFILKECILKLAGSLRNKRMLELGCGNGYWMRIFRDRGAICTGVDKSKEQIKLAEFFNSKGITYVVSDAEKFQTKERFDIVFIDHVISETPSYKKVVRILRQARALLKRKGSVILNEMHPSVAHFPFGNLKTGRDYFYFKRGAPFTIRVKQTNNKRIRIRDYHWVLQDFSDFLKKAGFVIDEIVEPRAKKIKLADNYLKIRSRYPSHFLIKVFPK